jgi:hypothetical protein
VLLISHRYNTVRDADHIYVLDTGQIIEHGSHDQLIATGASTLNCSPCKSPPTPTTPSPTATDHPTAAQRRLGKGLVRTRSNAIHQDLTTGLTDGSRCRVAPTIRPARPCGSGVRRWKPAPEPYLWAAQELGVEPGQVALVASHPWDCAGARSAGLRSGWVNRASVVWLTVFPPPDVTGHDIPAVVAALLRPDHPH